MTPRRTSAMRSDHRILLKVALAPRQADIEAAFRGSLRRKLLRGIRGELLLDRLSWIDGRRGR